MTGSGAVLFAAAIAIALLMSTTWLASLALRDASIVDPVWPFGFVLVAVVSAVVADGNTARRVLLVVLVSVWGLRLCGYLAWRKWGEPEDFRYQAMRRRWGSRFGLVSLLTVFLLQGVLMWIVSLPVQLGSVRAEPDLGPLAVVGIVVWCVGVVFESVGDAQLARFKADPANAGQVMNQGLWRYTRHPNYFGDACVWWGIAVVAAESGLGAIGIVGAVVMNVLLRRVSGVVLLEKSLVRRRAGYAEYVATTSAFIPRPPRVRDRDGSTARRTTE